MMMVVNNIQSIIIVHQIWVYKTKLHKTWFDMKMLIFYIGAFNQINTWFHYNFMANDLLSKTFFLFEICRFVQFFFIFYYYCHKAGNLLPDKEKIILILKVLFVVGLAYIIILGIGIWIYINENPEEA